MWNGIIISRNLPILFTIALSLAACGPTETQIEFDESHVRQDALEVVSPGVDLIAMDPWAGSLVAQPGQKLKVTLAIANQGTDTAALSQMRCYLSVDNVFDSDDQYLNYDRVAALAPGEASAENANVRVPADWPEGDAFLIFVADAKAEIQESNEANNAAVLSIQVGGQPPATSGDGPDLLVRSVSLESYSVEAGNRIVVNAVAVNEGTTAASGSRLKYYLSQNDTLDGGDKYLNYDNVSALAVGETGQESANIRIPNDAEDGTWYVLVVADANAQLVEQNETNNTYAAAITIGAPLGDGLPDLHLAHTSLALGTVTAGETVALQATIENMGQGAAGTAQVQYLLSRDESLDEYDTQLSFDTVEPLGIGGRRIENANLRIRENTVGGLWYIIVAIDLAGEVTESNEENNQVVLPIEVGRDTPNAFKADLVAQGVQVGAEAALAGEQVQVQLEVRNIGPDNADASRLKYYLSTDTFFEPSDRYLNYDAVHSLAPGEFSAEGANLRIPGDTPDGSYFFLFVVDDTDAVDEQYESNNVVALPITVGMAAVELSLEGIEEESLIDAADLVIESLSVMAGEFEPGEQVPVTLMVANRGVVAAPASRVKYYVSRDTTLDAFDRYGGYDRVTVLGVDESGAEAGNPRVPSDATGGLWYVLAVADANDHVSEREEENNVSAVPFMVNVDQPEEALADIIIENVLIDEYYVAANSKISVTLTLRNAGVLDAAETRVKFYLSGDENYDATDEYLDYQDAKALVVGDDVDISASLRIPYGAASGSWYVLVVADVNGSVEEQYESNNISPHLITVDPSGAQDEPYAFACPDYLTQDSTVYGRNTVASMNVLHLGWENSKDFEALACVLSHFSVVALNEVDNEAALQTLVAELETLTELDWAYHISPTSTGSGSAWEFYAFVWRTDRVEFLEPVGFFDDPAGVIKRDPYGANFKMGQFDFTLVAFHQRCGKTMAVRREEASHFGEIIEFFQAANGSENDLFIGGDFNLAGNDESFSAVGWNGVSYTVDPEQRTSIGGEGLRNSFDNIFYQSQHTTEILDRGVVDFTKGNHSTLRRTVSDHIPVWVEVAIDSDDD